MSIAENLKYLRKSHDLSQAEFGAIAGVSDKAVSTWEKGIKAPRMGAIQQIADHFGLKKSDIIEDYDPERSSLKGEIISAPKELELIKLYRNADEAFQAEAIEMLKRHQRKED